MKSWVHEEMHLHLVDGARFGITVSVNNNTIITFVDKVGTSADVVQIRRASGPIV